MAGVWFPLLKMRWVEGLTLNQFVGDHLDRPKMLTALGAVGQAGGAAAGGRAGPCRPSARQRALVSAGERGQLALKLIDYDGMYVPALAGKRSGESGHPAFQHPQRLREGIFSAEVDRFPHLAIYTAIHCLTLERRALWKEFDSSDNLLFRESDFSDPGRSKLFCVLWALKDANAHALVGRLVLACRMPLDQVPLLEQVVDSGDVRPLSREECGRPTRRWTARFIRLRRS